MFACFDTPFLQSLDLDAVFGQIRDKAGVQLSASLGVSESVLASFNGDRGLFRAPLSDYRHNASSLTPPPNCWFSNNLADSPSLAYYSGKISWLTGAETPQLRGMSFALATIPAGGVRDFQFSVNSHEYAVILDGDFEFGVFGMNEGLKTTLKQFDVSYTPKNWLSYFQNTGAVEGRILFVYSEAIPKFSSLVEMLTATPNSVLGTAFGVPSATFDDFNKSPGTPNPVNLPDECSSVKPAEPCKRSHTHRQPAFNVYRSPSRRH